MRAALPYAIQRYVNYTLDKNPNYDGEIGDVAVHLWRGAYDIRDIAIVKTTGDVPVPFFKAKALELSVQWRELLHGAIVTELHFFSPELNFVDAKSEKNSQTGAGEPWGETLEQLAPFKINRLQITDGAIHFRNFSAKPPVDLWIRQVEGEITNITNSASLGENLFAKAKATGSVLGGARLEVSVNLDPSAKKPTFDIDAKVHGLKLRALNAFFKEYAKLDFNSGAGDIVTEVACEDGKLKGYVKPIFKNIDMLSSEDIKQGDNIFEIAWEAIAGTVTELLNNQKKDQFATKIPIP